MTQKENPALDKRTKNRIKRNVKLANEIENKVEALEMRRPPYGIGAHLSDIVIALEEFNELVNEFLSTDVKDHETLGWVLTGVKTEAEHIYYHIKHMKKPLERMIEFCYEEPEDEKNR